MEKYRGYYSHIKDVARITMEFTKVAAFLEAISAMFIDVGVDVLDLKNMLDTMFSRTNLTDTSFVCFMSRTGSTAPNGIPKILVDTSMSW